MDVDIDPIFNLFIPAVERPDVAEVPDAIDSFVQQGTLANALGGHAQVERLADEIAVLDKQADSILKNRTAPAAAALTDDPHTTLAKRYAGIHKGKKAARVEKSANGKWIMEYDERGELLRGYLAEE